MNGSQVILLAMKAALSGAIVAAASETARRWPGVGALIVSLPLVSILALLWLWHDTHDGQRIAAMSASTFWYVLPTLPMFLLIARLVRQGMGFGLALAIGCGLTIGLYLALIAVGPRFGVRL